jgi:hypothetical protein
MNSMIFFILKFKPVLISINKLKAIKLVKINPDLSKNKSKQKIQYLIKLFLKYPLSLYQPQN